MAINTALLGHEVTLRRLTGYNREREALFDEATLSRVRIVPTTAKTDGTGGAVSSDSAVLYVDAVKSYITAVASDEEEGDEATEDAESGEVSEESTGEDDTSDDDTSDDAASSPATAGYTPKTGDEIVFEGRVWKAQSVKTVHDKAGAVHHYEVTLA